MRREIITVRGNPMSLVFQNIDPHPPLRPASVSSTPTKEGVGYALTFASEAKFEIEAKISKKAWFHMIHFDAKHQKSEAKAKVK